MKKPACCDPILFADPTMNLSTEYLDVLIRSNVFDPEDTIIGNSLSWKPGKVVNQNLPVFFSEGSVMRVMA